MNVRRCGSSAEPSQLVARAVDVRDEIISLLEIEREELHADGAFHFDNTTQVVCVVVRVILRHVFVRSRAGL